MKTNLMRKKYILQKLFHPIMSSQSNMKYDPELAKTKCDIMLQQVRSWKLKKSLTEFILVY